MARSVKATQAKKPVTPAPKQATGAGAAAPKLSKEELRIRVETLEHTVASLRTKNREANRAAKIAAARITELEELVVRLEQQAAPAKRAAKPAATAPSKARGRAIDPGDAMPPARGTRGKRRGRAIDPGDAVPPGVAVQEPEPLDEAAESALHNLTEHLGATDSDGR